MQIPYEQLISALIGECFKYRNMIAIMFIIISVSLLYAGTIWPKNYTSFSIIHVDDSNILQPLMRGAAETTQTEDHVSNAREIIFGERIMDQLLEDAGWLEEHPTEIEKEKIKNNIKSKIIINQIGENLLRITYTDKDQMRAYISAKRISDLFIEEGERSKIEESESAYNFIEKQVNEYLDKLTKVEEELRVFRSENPDSRPELETSVANDISQLKREINQTELLLRETSMKHSSLQNQLSGEATITISHTRDNQFRESIAEAQQKLDQLRLDYKETYPDIIRLKHQINDLKNALKKETENRELVKKMALETGEYYIEESSTLNPLYQQLRSNLSDTETEMATLETRIKELGILLGKEYKRAENIYGSEATLSKLTRNYQVNQEIYQDLLRRLENARVSRNLDLEQQGLTFKIQEPAKIALLPTGLRFMHFALAGIVLGISIPIGLIYVLLQLDPRIRYSQVIQEELGIPVIAEIQQHLSTKDRHNFTKSTLVIGMGILVIFILYGYVGWLKYTGQI